MPTVVFPETHWPQMEIPEGGVIRSIEMGTGGYIRRDSWRVAWRYGSWSIYLIR